MRIIALLMALMMVVGIAAAQEAKPLSAANIAALKTNAQAGDVRAQVALGRAYEAGSGVSQNDAAAVKWYRAAAEKGDADGQNSLGVMYRLGHGVEQDKAEAVKWYALAAKQGFGPALYNMAVAYYNGDGVGVSDGRAYAFFTLAKRAEIAGANDAIERMKTELSPTRLIYGQTTLANMLMKGDGVPADPKAGVAELKDVADQGDRDAQLTLARIYVDGQLVPADYAAAYQLCKRAAEKSREGVFCLADLTAAGKGTTTDPRAALELYRKTADMGSVRAFARLGSAYRDGVGVRSDKLAAFMYFVIGANLKDADCSKALAQLAASMTPKEIEEAKKKATKWLQERPAMLYEVKRVSEESKAGKDTSPSERQRLGDEKKW